MGKPSHPRGVGDNEAQCIVSNIRVSPRKLNLVAAMIRGQPAQQAVAALTFSKKRIAGTVKKTLESAIANAENNHGLDVDDLIVAQAYVGKALVMKRFTPRARGRASRIIKPFSRIRVVVRELGDEAENA